MATVQIFLSAVSAEFRSYRDALRRDLDRPNVTVKVQEDFIATGTETLDKLDAYIRQCDAAIHLVGDMTGAPAQPPSVALLRQRYRDFSERFSVLRPFLQPDAPALSYTQWEAWLTLFHRKVLIIAVPQSGAVRDTGYRLDDAQRAAQQEHLARLASVERYPEIRFANADRLVVEVMRSGLHDVLTSARLVGRRVKTTAPPRESNRRYLRGYAFDPHMPPTLEPGEKNEIVYAIPLEPLYPGPRGELIEVIDHDPAAGCFYEPVDLEHPDVIRQDGLAPSEADPRFHQQSVYAVAMTTIGIFEQALGRRVMWSGRYDGKAQAMSFVQRLRIYPHALRSPHAYYDPDRIALLFGYFSSPAEFTPDNAYPDGVVFTCLSPQAVASETALAILDGMHPAVMADENRDTVAFKLAFTDIVGLLQHVSMPGVLRRVIARPGAVRSIRHTFGELATQTGATSYTAALRNAIGAHDAAGNWKPHLPDPGAFIRTTDIVPRAAIVVAAFFGTYVNLVEQRTVDALRGVERGFDTARDSPPPDLVEELEDEGIKTARQLLTMCVRALDYCPPVEVNAGDFLRAFVTADDDAEPQTAAINRTAIVDAFRAHGIHPLGFRSLSTEMLAWNPPSELASGLLRSLIQGSLRMPIDRLAVLDDLSADARFAMLHRWSRDLHESFGRFLPSLRDPDREALASELGFDPSIDSTSLRVTPPRITNRRTSGAGRVFISVVQSRPDASDANETHPSAPRRGGSMIVVKFGTWEIEHIIRKTIRPR